MQPSYPATTNYANDYNAQVVGGAQPTVVPIQSGQPGQPVPPMPTVQPGQPMPPIQPGQPMPPMPPMQPGQPMPPMQPGQPMPPVAQGIPVAGNGAVDSRFMPIPSQYDPSGPAVSDFAKHLDVLNNCSIMVCF